MIIVTVELKSAIADSRSKVLGRLIICNDGTAVSNARGNYTAEFFGSSGGAGKKGRVENYPRLAVSIWNLVRRACETAGYTK